MAAKQRSSLLTELEGVKHLAKLAPEDRRMETRTQMYAELRALEKEYRNKDEPAEAAAAATAATAATPQKQQREKARDLQRWQQREEAVCWRQEEAKWRAQQERRERERQALEKERQDRLQVELLHRRKDTMVEDEARAGCASDALTKTQHRRPEEAELCRPPRAEDMDGDNRWTSDTHAKEQKKKKPLYNEWVRERTDSESDKEEHCQNNNNTYLLFTVIPGPKTEEREPSPKPRRQILPEQLSLKYWINKYQDRKREKRRKLGAENSSLNSYSPDSRLYQHDEMFTFSGNTILKSVFHSPE